MTKRLEMQEEIEKNIIRVGGFLMSPHGLWDLTRDGTHAPCSGSMES